MEIKSLDVEIWGYLICFRTVDSLSKFTIENRLEDR